MAALLADWIVEWSCPQGRGSLPVTVPNITGPKVHRLAYFWPGLPQLWSGGSWAGLLVAVGFTALANVLLMATFVFCEWLPLQTRLIGLGSLTVVWLLSRWQSRAERRAIVAVDEIEATEPDQEATEAPPSERDQLFREVQGHYLRNDWVAAEQLLLKLLKQDARDAESRLMLATLWRHQGRTAEASRQLDRLARLEVASSWQHEIAAERVAIEELESEPPVTDENESFEDASLEQAEVTETKVKTDGRDYEDRRAA